MEELRGFAIFFVGIHIFLSEGFTLCPGPERDKLEIIRAICNWEGGRICGE
jgi:hypothetical protein